MEKSGEAGRVTVSWRGTVEREPSMRSRVEIASWSWESEVVRKGEPSGVVKWSLKAGKGIGEGGVGVWGRRGTSLELDGGDGDGDELADGDDELADSDDDGGGMKAEPLNII